VRILFVSDDPEDIRIGAVKAPHRIAEMLRERGHEVRLLFRRELGEWPENERLRMGLASWLAWRAVERVWREDGPYDVIDVVGMQGFLLCRLRRFCRFREARLVVRSHLLDRCWFAGVVDDHRAGLLRKPWYRRWLFPLLRVSQERGALRRADAVIVNNRGEAALIERRGWQPAGRIHRIPHGVLRRRWAEAPEPGAARGAGVLFSGTWHTGKGIHYLAEAHYRLLERGVRLPLTLLSAMEDEDPEALDYEIGVIRDTFAPESRPWLTVLARFADQDRNFALYRSHDLLVCPSSTESFGLVVVEALSQRLPVICTSEMGAAEELRHGVEALLIPVRNAGALAEAMERLWRDPGLRERLGEAGHRAAHRLSWGRAAEATLAVYAAAGRGAGARVPGAVPDYSA